MVPKLSSKSAAKEVVIDEPLERLGSVIKEIRLRRNITQADVAAAVGCTQSHLSRLESGEHGTTLSSLRKIADALETDVRVLLEAVLTSDPELSEQRETNSRTSRHQSIHLS